MQAEGIRWHGKLKCILEPCPPKRSFRGKRLKEGKAKITQWGLSMVYCLRNSALQLKKKWNRVEAKPWMEGIPPTSLLVSNMSNFHYCPSFCFKRKRAFWIFFPWISEESWGPKENSRSHKLTELCIYEMYVCQRSIIQNGKSLVLT